MTLRDERRGEASCAGEGMQTAVVSTLEEGLLKSRGTIMKVDIADGAKCLVLRSSITCYGQAEVLLTNEQ